jgi:hypothetical protein
MSEAFRAQQGSRKRGKAHRGQAPVPSEGGGQKKQNFLRDLYRRATVRPIRPTSIRAVAGGRHDVFAIAVGHKEVNKLFKLVEAGD